MIHQGLLSVRQLIRMGEGSVETLPHVMQELGITRPFLVTGRGSWEGSGAKAAIDPEGRYPRFSEFETNPRLEDATQGLEAFRAEDCDGIIAAGGGSVMDMAKLISAFAAQSASPEDVVTGKAQMDPAAVPVVAIPTTSGSGAEATHFAVVYIGQAKYSLAHQSLRPAAAIIDPALTHAMSAHLTACSGMDALAQAIEASWAVGSTAEARAIGKAAIRLIWPNLRAAVNNPTPEARKAMAEGAFKAGQALDIAKSTAPHALSYGMTKGYGIPHGHAVALTLGPFFEINASASEETCLHPEGLANLNRLLRQLAGLLGADSPAQAHMAITALMRDIGLPATTAEAGIPAEDLPRLADAVNVERLGNNPVKLVRDDLIRALSPR